MTSCVRILSTSSVDSTPSILLVNPDGSKILINCGEGCQRCFLEYGQRLSTVSTVLLCDTSPASLGGLPGMILTSADATAASDAAAILRQQQQQQSAQQNGVVVNDKASVEKGDDDDTTTTPLSGLEIFGPTGTKQFIHALRHFMRRDKFVLTVTEGSTGSTPKPTCVARNSRKRGKVNKKSTQQRDSAADDIGFTIQSLSCSASTVPNGTGSSRKHPRDNDDDDNNLERDQEQSRQQEVLSFILRTPPIQGRFLTEKAMELGVPKGPMFGQLKSGQSVTFVVVDDNETNEQRTVHSSQVVAPSTPAIAVIVLFYPDPTIAQKLFTNQTLMDTAVKSSDCCVELVIHIATEQLFKEVGLPFWNSNNSTAQHIFLSTSSTSDVDGTPFQSACQGAKARSLLLPEVYRVPEPACSIITPASNEVDYRIGKATMEYILIPRSKRGFTMESSTTTEMETDGAAEALNLVTTTGALAAAKEALVVDTDLQQQQISTEETTAGGELIFTGTGAAMPCKHRNVTGMLLRQADGRSILLDVGEGTMGQLRRTHTHVQLSDIKAVWISHPHADHHLGLLSLLNDRKADEPILLLASTPIFQFLDEYARCINPCIRDQYVAIECSQLVVGSSNYNKVLQQKLADALGISNCRTVPVAHCAHAYALILDGTSFGRLVYSGDCRPSMQLAQAALGADVLIHEATFEDGMEAEATLKKHSTVGEALSIGRAMQCHCVILTHFSQRYPKIPPTPIGEYTFPIIFAFDYMRLRPQTLVAASKLTPALRLLFPEPESNKDEMDPSIASRAMAVPGVFARANLL